MIDHLSGIARWYQEDGLASPTTGYARKTYGGYGAVVASPLFVAYARQ